MIEAARERWRRKRQAIYVSAALVGTATWWSLYLVLRAVHDDLIFHVRGGTYSYAANVARAARWWSPMVGVLVAAAIVVIGRAFLAPEPTYPSDFGKDRPQVAAPSD